MTSETAKLGQDRPILLIEDLPAFVHALRALLPRKVIVSASTLREGLVMMREGVWSRVVLDLDLPDSPVEVTTAMIPTIRQIASGALLVVLTGYPVDRPALMNMGAVAVIMKGEDDWLPKLEAML